MTTKPSKKIETFPNPRAAAAAQPSKGRKDYAIYFSCPEFTCLCPMTGQPDFAEIEISYTPDQLCVELKSLKLYLWSFREDGAFHEAVTNQILDDLVAAVDPLEMVVTGIFNVRGGITTTIVAEYERDI